jgi:hypothetical protein
VVFVSTLVVRKALVAICTCSRGLREVELFKIVWNFTEWWYVTMNSKKLEKTGAVYIREE